MPSVKVALDNLPDGATVEVPYLGYFKNGTTTEVDQNKWDRFVNHSPVGANFAEEDTLELTTEKQKEDAEAFKKLATLEGSSADDLEDDYKKDELVSLADSMGISTEGKNKDELAEDIAAARGTESEPESFSSVNVANVDNDEQES